MVLHDVSQAAYYARRVIALRDGRVMHDGEPSEVVTAAHGGEGLERVAERVPTVILLDLMMPEMDGFDFLAELRKTPAGAAVPVVVLTAKDLSADDRARTVTATSVTSVWAAAGDPAEEPVSAAVRSRLRADFADCHPCDAPASASRPRWGVPCG